MVLRPMPTPRNHLAAAAVNDKLYAIGGRPGDLIINEEYDPKTDTWRARADMPTGRSGIAAAAIGRRVYVFGGENAHTFDENEEYDPQANTWKAMAPMPTARHGLAAVPLGGSVYVLGGGPQPGFAFSAVNEVFHPAAIADR